MVAVDRKQDLSLSVRLFRYIYTATARLRTLCIACSAVFSALPANHRALCSEGSLSLPIADCLGLDAVEGIVMGEQENAADDDKHESTD